jgi:hypothetical protein
MLAMKNGYLFLNSIHSPFYNMAFFEIKMFHRSSLSLG